MTGIGRVPADIVYLAEVFTERQRLDPTQSKDVATRIAAADEDIWAAAMHWATEGDMPEGPVIAGLGPKLLSGSLNPSQVFTTLVALRRDPETTKRFLKYHGASLMRAGRREPDD
jgi:hypothetical protein